jgi:4-hydroxybenzoate polyprenyltransferase
MCYGFTVNAIGDISIDKFHDGHSKDMNLAQQPLVTGELKPNQAWVIAGIFLFGSVLASIPISNQFLVSIVLLLFLATIYSIRPFRLKTRPGMDIICNAAIGMMCFIAGNLLSDAVLLWVVYVAIFFMAATFYIPTVVTDFVFDKKAGESTSAVVFGPSRVLLSMYGLNAIVVISSIYVLLIAKLELQLLAVVMIVYTSVFTVVSRRRLQGAGFELHQNWILVPFGGISLVMVIYAMLKMLDLFSL